MGAKKLLGLGNNPRRVTEVCGGPVLLTAVCRGARTVDGNGHVLHFRFVFEDDGQTSLRVSGDGTQAVTREPLAVEFDIEGTHALNRRGTLYLVGGNPEDDVDLHIHKTPLDRPQFHWHALSGLVSTEAPYTIPELHTRISVAIQAGSIATVITYPGSMGTQIVGPEPVRLAPGAETFTSARPFWAATEWYG